MKNKSLSLLSLIIISNLLAPQPIRADGWNDFGKGLAVIGTAAVVVGTTIWACNQEESDSSLISRAENAYQNSFTMKPIDTKHYKLSGLPEEMVESICITLLKQNTADGIARIVKDHIASLSAIKSDLSKRIDSLRHKQAPENRAIIDTMLSLKEKIASRTAYIEKNIQTFLYYHQEYLKLFEYEQGLHKRYADELALLSYSFKDSSTGYRIKQSLCSQYHNQKYPYSVALEMVKKDISTLTYLLKKVTRSYPQREKMTYWVKDQLEYIDSIISTSGELEREYIQKEREELEKRERELEQKRIQKKRKKLEKLEQEHYRKCQR